MKTKILNDYNFDLSKGKIDNAKAVVLKGNAAITVAGNTPGNLTGLYAFPTVASVMEIGSSSASDDDQVIRIEGLNGNYKYQEEEVTLDGVPETPQVTTGLYIRVNLLEKVSGSDLVGNVTCSDGSTTFAKISAGKTKSQGTFYSAPAGSELSIEKVSITSSDTQAIKLVSTTDVYNITASYTDEKVYPITISGDFRLDGTSASLSDEISVTVEAREDKIESVPVAINRFSAVAGDKSALLTFDPYTTSDTQDCAKLVFTVGDQVVESVPSEYEVPVYNLINGMEYTCTGKWVGYDGKESTIVTDTVTPVVEVQNPVATSPLEEMAVISWDIPTDPLFDTVEIYIGTDITPTVPDHLEPGRAIFEGLTDVTDVDFKIVTVYKAVGEEDPVKTTGKTVTLNPEAEPSFPAPTSFVVTPGEGRLELSWVNPIADGFESVLVEANVGEWTDISSLLVNTSPTFGALKIDILSGELNFRISAIYATGTSEYVTGSGTSLAMGDVANLTATPGNTEVTLSWDADPTEDPYIVTFDITIDGGEVIPASNDPAVTSYVATGLTNGTEYDFVVKRNNASATPSTGVAISATPTSGT